MAVYPDLLGLPEVDVIAALRAYGIDDSWTIYVYGSFSTADGWNDADGLGNESTGNPDSRYWWKGASTVTADGTVSWQQPYPGHDYDPTTLGGYINFDIWGVDNDTVAFPSSGSNQTTLAEWEANLLVGLPSGGGGGITPSEWLLHVPTTTDTWFTDFNFGVYYHRGRVWMQGVVYQDQSTPGIDEFGWTATIIPAGGILESMRPATDTAVLLPIDPENSGGGTKRVTLNGTVGADGSLILSGADALLTDETVTLGLNSVSWPLGSATDSPAWTSLSPYLTGGASTSDGQIAVHGGVVHLRGDVQLAPDFTLAGAPQFLLLPTLYRPLDLSNARAVADGVAGWRMVEANTNGSVEADAFIVPELHEKRGSSDGEGGVLQDVEFADSVPADFFTPGQRFAPAPPPFPPDYGYRSGACMIETNVRFNADAVADAIPFYFGIFWGAHGGTPYENYYTFRYVAFPSYDGYLLTRVKNGVATDLSLTDTGAGPSARAIAQNGPAGETFDLRLSVLAWETDDPIFHTTVYTNWQCDYRSASAGPQVVEGHELSAGSSPPGTPTSDGAYGLVYSVALGSDETRGWTDAGAAIFDTGDGLSTGSDVGEVITLDGVTWRTIAGAADTGAIAAGAVNLGLVPRGRVVG